MATGAAKAAGKSSTASTPDSITEPLRRLGALLSPARDSEFEDRHQVVFVVEGNSMRDPVHYKLLGFSENGSIRRFIFKIGDDPMAAPFTVIADVDLARKMNVGLQELPSLCARLLEAGGNSQSSRIIRVTPSDLDVVATAKAAAMHEAAEKRARRFNRSKTPVEAPEDQLAPTTLAG